MLFLVSFFGESNGPNIGLFQYFVNVGLFESLDLTNGNFRLPNDKITSEEKKDLINFINNRFLNFQPRDDSWNWYIYNS